MQYNTQDTQYTYKNISQRKHTKHSFPWSYEEKFKTRKHKIKGNLSMENIV